MKSHFHLLVPLLLLTLPTTIAAQTAASQQAPPLPPQEVFRRLSPSVFVVEALDPKDEVVAFGSGVAVAADQIVTNKHVIENAIKVRVRSGQKTWPASVTHLDADHDLCRLKVEGLKAPPLEVRESSTLEVGERVYAIGAPKGLELTFSEGVISALRDISDVRIIQTTASISSGSSGGGLFDARGRLVGITTARLLGGQNLNFAVPGEWVLALEQAPILTPPTGKDRGVEYQALLWAMRGFKHGEKGEYDQEIQAYREAIRLKPDFAKAWNNLGVAYLKLQQFDQAIRAYREAIRLKPAFAEAWSNLGVAYRKLGQHDQAIQAYREAIRLKPDFAEAWSNLGVAYGKLGQYDQAIRASDMAILFKPDDALAWYSLGLAYSRKGNRSKVMEVYQRLKELDPELADRFFNKFVLP